LATDLRQAEADAMLRITISARQPLLLAGIRAALSDPLFELLGEARTVGETIPLIASTQPDVALVSTGLRDIDPLALVNHVALEHPSVKVMLLSKTRDPAHIQAAFSRGAWAYILESIDFKDLGAAVRIAALGTAYLARGLPALENSELEALSFGLTPRELTIVKALPRGLSNKQIAAELWVTEQTVKFHLTNIYRKIGVGNRVEAIRWAIDRGLT
jgi:DNA-binding NarL/FixJ family response regulator